MTPQPSPARKVAQRAQHLLEQMMPYSWFGPEADGNNIANQAKRFVDRLAEAGLLAKEITPLAPARKVETSEHTPGPWGSFWNEENARLHLGSWRFTHEGHHALPLMRCSEGNAKARANARLIAAAPDMLAALKAALPHLDNSSSPGGCDGSQDGCDHCGAIRSVRAAIARATRESQ